MDCRKIIHRLGLRLLLRTSYVFLRFPCRRSPTANQLEYDSESAGGFEPLRHFPRNKRLVLGLVSTKTREVSYPRSPLPPSVTATPYILQTPIYVARGPSIATRAHNASRRRDSARRGSAPSGGSASPVRIYFLFPIARHKYLQPVSDAWFTAHYGDASSYCTRSPRVPDRLSISPQCGFASHSQGFAWISPEVRLGLASTWRHREDLHTALLYRARVGYGKEAQAREGCGARGVGRIVSCRWAIGALVARLAHRAPPLSLSYNR